MIKQLNPPIPVITPKGKALAHFVIDYGMEHDLHWVCFQDSTCECWSWSNRLIRAQINITQGRDYASPFYHPSEVSFKQQEEEDDGDDSLDENDFEYEMKINELEMENRSLVKEKYELTCQLSQEGAMAKRNKNLMFDLQDLLLKLLRFNKIGGSETEEVINILIKTGMDESDISALGTNPVFNKF